MLYIITFSSAAAYSALMIIFSGATLYFNVKITKKANAIAKQELATINAKFKKEQMDKKLNKEDFEKYETDHKDVHERDRKDMLYIRAKVDEIALYLLNKK